MKESMKKIGRAMSICMGITMSFFLSLIGTISSGHFTPIGFIISFIVSTIVSMIIGLVIPIGKVTSGACRKAKLKMGTLPEKLLSSLISDLIYTPIMTFVMVFLAYQMAMKQSGGMAQLSFIHMFLPSLGICFVAGFVLIFIFTPLFMSIFMKKYGPGGRSDM